MDFELFKGNHSVLFEVEGAVDGAVGALAEFLFDVVAVSDDVGVCVVVGLASVVHFCLVDCRVY